MSGSNPQPLVGYQEIIEWMGARVLTLADVWPERPHAMIVGLNPAPKSVEAGHYYQGRVGKTQMARLAKYGVFAPSTDGFIEANAVEAGVGFSDLVKRPTTGEKDVAPAELAYGRAALDDVLSRRGVDLVICVFRHPVEALLGAADAPGFQARRTSWGAKVFRMPGPFERGDVVEQVMGSLRV